MRVLLSNGWFGPTVPETVGNRTLSGHFYDKGEQDMPDWLFPYLPRTAVVLIKPDGFNLDTVKEIPAETLRDYDIQRAAAEAEGRVLTNIEKARLARMAKLAAKKAASN